MIEQKELSTLLTGLQKLSEGFADLPPSSQQHDWPAMAEVLNQVAEKMQDNYPYHHPLYAGQMLKPPHPMARMAYTLSMWINPNNHALDGGRASSALEFECVAAIGKMFGLDKPLGHLCGGGTMANLEALWVAGRLSPGKTVLASAQAHYTHGRISEVLALDFATVAARRDGRMDMAALEQQLQSGNIGTVVATLGNTGIGAVDPLDEILALREKYDFRLHVDAAYGGYFKIAGMLGPDARTAFECIAEADSIVIDPHKHGLQPYGCGCVLFRDPSVGALYKHDSPYTYFSSSELHLGEISLECSRPGASAVALWATQQLLPMTPGETFSKELDQCLLAAREMYKRIDESEYFQALIAPQLDIVVYGARAATASAASAKANEIFEKAAERDLHLALISLPVEMIQADWPDLEIDQNTVTCLRSCLMKPEHLEWIDEIVTILEDVAG